MRTIAIINQKGGCGKTTVSINLAATLAAEGKRTLLVDMDPQSHCSLGLAVPEQQVDYALGDMLRAGLSGALSFTDIVWQISRNLDLAPSTMSLAAIEQELAREPDKDQRLAHVLSVAADRYDYCVIDCPPSIGLLTFNALRAAREVIIPVETGYFALQGSIRQEETLQMLAKRVNHWAKCHVLATMYDVRTKLAREILSELRKHFGDRLLPMVVHFNSKLKEAASFGQPITEYDPASKGMQDFKDLVSWLNVNPPTQPGSEGSQETMNPALDRAAELVQRARALSARTASMAARIGAPESGGATAAVRAEPVVRKRVVADPREIDDEARIEEKVARAYGVRQTLKGLLFIQPAKGAQRVGIAGDFNNWNPSDTPMARDTSLGVWQTRVDVPPGRYRYRIVVDGKWTQDPYNSYVEANPYGELNSVIEVGLKLQ